MEEKRRKKRLELTVTLELKNIGGADTEAKELPVEVMDVSSGGIGFRSHEKLDADGYYNTQMVIWTKEVIPCVIHIVRETTDESGAYCYGGIFVGMNEIEQRKIDIYEMIAELEEGKTK